MQDRKAIKGLLDRVPDELRNVDVLVNNVRPLCRAGSFSSAGNYCPGGLT